MTNEELWKRTERALGNITPNGQLYFEVHIVEHCNLNCKQCSHFSPLADEEYLDISIYKKDIDRLSELFEGEMSSVFLMGGEPLLHPQVTEFMKITREAFPVGKIVLVTNGLLLPTMPDFFWEECKKYDVTIEPTCYPVKFDYAGTEKLINSKGVKYTPFNSVHNVQWKAFPIHQKFSDVRGIGKCNFLNCAHVSSCVDLKNGKLYPCPTAAHALHLKKYFNLDIHLSKKDGVDIYSVKSGDELLEKLSRPIPFCQYCDVTSEYITSDFGISKKDRYEWLAFEFTEDDMKYLKSESPTVYVFGAGKWGSRTVSLLRNEGVEIRNVITTRKKQGIDNILDVPIVTLDELGKAEPDSICLVALGSHIQKEEVYPLLCSAGFGDVVPVSGIG